MPIRIGDRPVGEGQPLFVVAEIGLNHGGHLERGLALIDGAAGAGASAVKLQSLRADRLVAASSPAPQHVRAASLREFFRTFELDLDAHRALATRARRHGLVLLSTPFDEQMVDLLETIGCDAYKIASGDLTHHRLIERAASTGKPVIVSTGMSHVDEVIEAVRCAQTSGANGVVVLHCVSSYPVPPGSENLRALTGLARIGVPVGLSDHSRSPVALALALALGAAVYEKHLVLPGDRDAIDREVSATPKQLGRLVRYAGRVRQMLGSGVREPQAAEAGNITASRRSLFAARDLCEGEVVTPDAVVALRPAIGLDPRRWTELVGRRMPRAIGAGEPFQAIDLAASTEVS